MLIISQYAAAGDGINTSLRVIQTMVETGKTLSELHEPLTIYPQLLKNVVVEDKHAVMESAVVREAVAGVERALEGDGRALVRASGTEPLVRVMVEAPTMELCERHVNDVIAANRIAVGRVGMAPDVRTHRMPSTVFAASRAVHGRSERGAAPGFSGGARRAMAGRSEFVAAKNILSQLAQWVYDFNICEHGAPIACGAGRI